jgi:hypothetical protein
MRFHRLASILSSFCCQTVGSLCVLHFRICDVSSETGRSKSFVCRCVQDRFGCRKFFRTPLDRRRIVAIVCDTAVSRRERFTSRERVRQTVAFRPAFACSVFVRFHFKPESTRQRRRFGKLQAGPSIRVRRHPMQPAIADRTPPRLDSALHPTVPLRGSVETMPRANCSGQSWIMM